MVSAAYCNGFKAHVVHEIQCNIFDALTARTVTGVNAILMRPIDIKIAFDVLHGFITFAL